MSDQESTLWLAINARRAMHGARTFVGATGRIVKAAFSAKTAVLGLVGSFSAMLVIRRIYKDITTFETGLVGVGKTADLSGRALESFGKSIIGLSKNIPVATSELLSIAQAAGQLGVKGSDNILIFTDTVAKLGTASNLAGEEAATVLARMLNVTGEAVDSVDVLASVIVALGNTSAATEREIARHATMIAQSTAVFNTSSAEAAGLGAALASLGARAELGGSALGRAFRAMDASIRQSGRQLEYLSELTGKTDDEITQLFRKDAVGAFQLFLQGLGKVIENGGDATQTLKQFGLQGEEILKILPTLAKNYDIVARSLRTARGELENTTALEEEATRAFETLESRMKMLGNTIVAVSLKIGDILLPKWKEWADSAKSFVESNETTIAKWAELFYARMTFALDVARDFLRFFRSDWKSGIEFGLFATTELFKAFGKSVWDILKLTFVNIGTNIIDWLKEGWEKRSKINELSEEIFKSMAMERGGRYITGVGGMGGGATMLSLPEGVNRDSLKKAARLLARDEMGLLNPDYTGIQSGISSHFQKARIAIETEAKNLGFTFDDSWSKYQATVNEIVQRYQLTEAVNQFQGLYEKLGLDKLVDKFRGMFKAASSTSVKSGETLTSKFVAKPEDIEAMQRAYQAIDAEISILGKLNETRERALEIVRFQTLANKAHGEGTRESIAAMDLYNEKLDELKKAHDLEKIARGIGDSFGRAFEDMVMGARSAGEAIRALADDVARLLIRQMITEPLAQGISGMVGGIFGPSQTSAQLTAGTSLSTPNAAAESWLSNATPFARGGIVNRPTYFPMSGGRAGLMGERSEEAIMPLTRGPGGGLGVQAYGEGASTPVNIKVELENKSGQKLEAQQTGSRFDGDAYIVGVVLQNIQSNGVLRNTIEGVNNG